MEEIEEQRLDDVVAMMAERDLRKSIIGRERVQRSATKPRAEAAHRFPFRNHAADDAVRVLLEDVELDADLAKIIRQHVRIVAGLLLIEMHRDDLEAHRSLRLELQQNVEQRV